MSQISRQIVYNIDISPIEMARYYMVHETFNLTHKFFSVVERIIICTSKHVSCDNFLGQWIPLELLQGH